MRKKRKEFYFTLELDSEAFDVRHYQIATYCAENQLDLLFFRRIMPNFPEHAEIRISAKNEGQIKKLLRDLDITPENIWSKSRRNKQAT